MVLLRMDIIRKLSISTPELRRMYQVIETSSLRRSKHDGRCKSGKPVASGLHPSELGHRQEDV